MTILIHTNCVH